MIIHCPACGAAFEAKPVVSRVDMSQHSGKVYVDFDRLEVAHPCEGPPE